jgi:hypothetical protein
MPTMIKQQLRILNAKNFIDRFNGVPTTTDYLYLGIAGQTAWANEANPPAPADTFQEITDFWSDLIGLHRIATTDSSLAVPRINWTSGTEYFTIDPTLENPWQNPVYFVTTNFDVYLCTGAPGGVTSTIMPTHTAGSVTDAEGYTFQYLYTLSNYSQTNLMTASWLPVEWGLAENTYENLNAKYIIVRTKLLDTDLPTGVTYRKLGLILNPLQGTVSPGNPITANNVINTTPGTEIEIGSGDTVYIEFRSPITRNPLQSEEIKLVIEF